MPRKDSSRLGVLTLSATALVGAVLATVALASNRPGAFTDDFTGTSLDPGRWVVASGQAPGFIANNHIGYYQPDHVSVSGGNLVLLLTQDTGTVGTNPVGVISRGALVFTKRTYGYGTFEWRMRMSSTASSPAAAGSATSGSVSAGFIFVNNSQTEIDFEFPGNLVDTLYFVNWLNPNPAVAPNSTEESFSTAVGLGVAEGFHDYKFVWAPGIISFYVDGVLFSTHMTNVPIAPAHFMMNHWGTNSTAWGGAATVGVSRYFYVDSVSYTPL